MQDFTLCHVTFFLTVYLHITSKLSEELVFQSSGITAIINLRSFVGKLRHNFEDDIASTALNFLQTTHAYVGSSWNDTHAHTHSVSHTNSTTAVSTTKGSLYK